LHNSIATCGSLGLDFSSISFLRISFSNGVKPSSSSFLVPCSNSNCLTLPANAWSYTFCDDCIPPKNALPRYGNALPAFKFLGVAKYVAPAPKRPCKID